MSAIDWSIVAALCAISMAVGLFYARRSASAGAVGYFTASRSLPWWAIGFSNTATYQSGNGAFVMIVLTFGLVGNWIWWSSWVIWMPLVAIIWARLWRRMQIVTTAELITLRYGGRPAVWARRAYATIMGFGIAILMIGYITGFFAKTIAPLVPLSEIQILLIFGGITVIYTMFGGLVGVVYVDVVQFLILMVGNVIFLFLAIGQFGGWEAILHRIAEVRPEAIEPLPPTRSVDILTVSVLAAQGLLFAGSPTAGEGYTAQRFMAARNEAHALGGQLLNAALALCIRLLPLIGIGLIALSLFWTENLGPTPAGMTVVQDPAHAWGELVKRVSLPIGFVGLLVAAEVAAYMSTLSTLMNWGGSFVVNDLVPQRWLHSGKNRRREVWVSRLTTLALFIGAGAVAILYVKQMTSWFLFINGAMVSFILPLAAYRFFWWRFNVWGEIAAIVLGLPLSILVWFVLDFQSRPVWQGTGLLFISGFVVLTLVALLTPAERPETLDRFYQRCRPPGFWRPVQRRLGLVSATEMSATRLVPQSLYGIGACLGLVIFTNAVFVAAWAQAATGVAMSTAAVALLIRSVWSEPPQDIQVGSQER